MWALPVQTAPKPVAMISASPHNPAAAVIGKSVPNTIAPIRIRAPKIRIVEAFKATQTTLVAV